MPSLGGNRLIDTKLPALMGPENNRRGAEESVGDCGYNPASGWSHPGTEAAVPLAQSPALPWTHPNLTFWSGEDESCRSKSFSPLLISLRS